MTESPKHVVVLVHGIRTQAPWAEMVASVLDKLPNVIVQPIRYGFFDLVRFLCPVYTRRKPIARVVRELRDIGTKYPGAKISAIAHSFGTHALISALNEQDIELHRVIFCASIVKDDFRYASYRAQLGPDGILNDCGTLDFLPLLAASVTWGYGATGTFGFGTLGVKDRFHDFRHSDYFKRDFVEKYWLPFIANGEILETDPDMERVTPPYWQSVLAWTPIRWIFAALVAAGLVSLFLTTASSFLDARIKLLWGKTLENYASYITIEGTRENCAAAKCRITFHDVAFLRSPRGIEASYEGRGKTSGRILSFSTEPRADILNPEQYPANPTYVEFKILPRSSEDRELVASGEMVVENTVTEERGKVGPHVPYDCDILTYVLDMRGLGFSLKGPIQARIESKDASGRLVSGHAVPRINYLDNGKVILVTARNVPAQSSVYVIWGNMR